MEVLLIPLALGVLGIVLGIIHLLRPSSNRVLKPTHVSMTIKE